MITIVLLSHQNIELLKMRVNEFISYKSELVRLMVVESGIKEYILPQLSMYGDSRLKFIFGEKFGIYSAMNRAISCIETRYYLVLGLDDEFKYNEIAGICDHLNSGDCDILFLGVKKGLSEMVFFKPDKISSGPQGIFPSHTGGAIIRSQLHEKYGKYDENFKVVADGLFILRCLKGGVFASLYPYICCKVGDQGFSKKNEFLAEYESFKVRCITGEPVYYSFIIFFIRMSRRLIKRLLSKLSE